MSVRVAINGFGRIGRNVFRAARDRASGFEIVAVNDLMDLEDRRLPAAVRLRSRPVPGHGRGRRRWADRRRKAAQVVSERDPAELPWGELGVEVVVESTGLLHQARRAPPSTSRPARARSSSARPRPTPTSRSASGSTTTSTTPATHHVISNASCTTNCLAPLAKTLHENFGIERGFMTTTHAYTNDQQVLDLPHTRPAPGARRPPSTSSRPRPARPRRSVSSSPR